MNRFLVALLVLLMSGTPCLATGLSPADTIKAKAILQNQCSRCHTAPKPQSHTVGEWGKYVDQMAPMARLSASDKALLLSYLKANAGKGSAPHKKTTK